MSTILLEKDVKCSMENMIAVLVIVILVGSAAAYLIKAKRSGVKCVGCPAGGNCSSKIKRKKEIDGSGHRKENHVYYRNAL